MSGHDRAPLSEQFPHIRTPWMAIAAELRYAAEHDMIPGEPVGSAAELAQLYGVNRKTARKALVALAAEGLIEVVPGSRYRVPRTRQGAPPA
jgi:DNA-binding GntR family transcriptional regulator